MNEMIAGRVRRAVFNAYHHGDRPYDWDAVARAAIAAMREPTHTMLFAGWRTLPVSVPLDVGPADIGEIWRAMIDDGLE